MDEREEDARWARREAKRRAQRSRIRKSGLTLKTVLVPTIERKAAEAEKRVASKRGRPRTVYCGVSR